MEKKYKRMGSIYKEAHNHGRRRESGNSCSRKFVRGVGQVRVYGYRWVAEIKAEGKRYRKRSADFNVVYFWLRAMRERLN